MLYANHCKHEIHELGQLGPAGTAYQALAWIARGDLVWLSSLRKTAPRDSKRCEEPSSLPEMLYFENYEPLRCFGFLWLAWIVSPSFPPSSRPHPFLTLSCMFTGQF